MSRQQFDVVVIGAGAAGLMCAIEAGKRGRKVCILEHAEKPGKKILISGGGRCNFTNAEATPAHFLSDNPPFCISALKRYGPKDFVALVERHGITYHEKKLGQLFCDQSARQIVAMLLHELAQTGGRLLTGSSVTDIARTEAGFTLQSAQGVVDCTSLVIATGGLSIPKMGASGFGYDIAAKFGIKLVPPRPGLVPFLLDPARDQQIVGLAGVSLEVETRAGRGCFREAMLFTHKGLSGPAMLQISSYWREGEDVLINLLPDIDLLAVLKAAKADRPRADIKTILSQYLPTRLADRLCGALSGKPMHAIKDRDLVTFCETISRWRFHPAGSEGYRTAEVTVGGVDTRDLSSQTMMARAVPGLYFIGEVVDVTGHLGGYNFQWAWSSGHAAGQVA